MKNTSFVRMAFMWCLALGAQSYAADIEIPGYQYSVTDIASRGLTADQLFRSMSTSWMNLEDSVCANRSIVWSYDLHRKYKINTGTIFIFFGSKVWEGEKHKYWYHAGTYVVENGKELVMEQSYPSEVFRPLTVLEWMRNEMEDAVDEHGCVELKKGEDPDLAALFYYKSFLPNKRQNGKPAFDCYYRKVPGYIPYPETTAELELGVDENGRKVDYDLKDYDLGTLYSACIDAYSGGKFFKRGAAKNFCGSYF